MKHPFEDIEVKINAPQLLEAALRSRRKKCMIGTGAMTDPYLPLEKELCLTRKCLELIEHYGFGAVLQTKSDLVLRDLDLLKKINEKTKCVVQMTLTTADEELCRILEPMCAPQNGGQRCWISFGTRGFPRLSGFARFCPLSMTQKKT